MQEPTLRIVAIGNAIVDVIGEADEAFLETHGLGKGLMRLVGGDEAERIAAALGSTTARPGGSAANTAAVASALGAAGAFLGKVRDDAAGRVFVDGMAQAGVACPVPPAAGGPATSRCVVAVTPDGERTMSTHLGACQTLSEADVDAGLVAGAGVLFLEGYAWTSPSLSPACRKALEAARGAGRRVALTLSDPGIAAAHRGELLDLVRGGLVDLVFANAREAVALAGTADVPQAVAFLRCERGTWVVTRSAEGALLVEGGAAEAVPAHPAEAVVDTTGAGDAYAGGYLAGLALGMPSTDCARLAGFAAAHVIGRIGARPEGNLADLARRAGVLA
jgi:sugar/nucleoside kinase (ribokinase family)